MGCHLVAKLICGVQIRHLWVSVNIPSCADFLTPSIVPGGMVAAPLSKCFSLPNSRLSSSLTPRMLIPSSRSLVNGWHDVLYRLSLSQFSCRWGRTAHLVFLFFGLATNIIVSSMLILGGSATVTALSGMHTIAVSSIKAFLFPDPNVPYRLASSSLSVSPSTLWQEECAPHCFVTSRSFLFISIVPF